MKALARHNPDRLVQLLAERLELERAGVKLYDAVIDKLRASSEEIARRALPELFDNRNEEMEHAEWLLAQIESLGETAAVRSDLVDLVRRESEGIAHVVAEDAVVQHLLHALLAAELLDSAGWDLLVELADEANDIDALRELERRKNEEEEHLLFVRGLVASIARREVLGGTRIVGHAD